jgi:hypothetical protein
MKFLSSRVFPGQFQLDQLFQRCFGNYVDLVLHLTRKFFDKVLDKQWNVHGVDQFFGFLVYGARTGPRETNWCSE